MTSSSNLNLERDPISGYTHSPLRRIPIRRHIQIARRDRREQHGSKRGAQTSRRARMSHFLREEEDDDAMDGGLGVSGMKRRTKRQYYEQRDRRRYLSSNLVTSRLNRSSNGSRTIVFAGPFPPVFDDVRRQTRCLCVRTMDP